jgi:glycosyltransferase involved in cell wall biosynthesis
VPCVKFMFKFIYRFADCFICVSDSIRDELVRRVPANAAKTVTVNNGVDTDKVLPLNKIDCRQQLGLPVDKRIFGFVGSVAPWHGIEDLLVAVKRLTEGRRDVLLLIVGGSEYSSQLNDVIDQLGIQEFVILTGTVEHDQIPVYIGSLDFAVQCHNDPVIGKYGDPLKFWEYLAAGRAVLLSSYSSSSEFVSEDLIGWVYEGGNIDDMVLKLRAAIDNPECAERIGANNREFAVNGHRWSDVARRVEHILKGNNNLDNLRL